MSGVVTILAHRRGSTNAALLRAWQELGVDARIADPEQAAGSVSPGDVVLARLDVLDTLDGIETGLETVEALEKSGARVLNRAAALRAAYDKLETARRLRAVGVPHPRTVCVVAARGRVELPPRSC